MKLSVIILFVLAGFPLIMLLCAYPFMWIWNYAVVGAISVAKPIDYWTSFWLAMFFAGLKSNTSSSKG